MGSYRSRSIYQLHIQLEEIEPAIWRRIIIPGKISLARLHRLLQLAMGWENYHLHLIRLVGKCHLASPFRKLYPFYTLWRIAFWCVFE